MSRRRIELPGVEVLFGNQQTAATPAAKPAPRRRAGALPDEPAAAPHKPKAKTPKAKKAKTAKPKAPRKPERATPLERLESVEGRLGELPVESLVDLRDGLEELLAATEIDERAVRRLLDGVEV